jgi:hypothetical protein
MRGILAVLGVMVDNIYQQLTICTTTKRPPSPRANNSFWPSTNAIFRQWQCFVWYQHSLNQAKLHLPSTIVVGETQNNQHVFLLRA